MNALQKIRNYKGLTQYDLSCIAKVSVTYIHDLEKGKKRKLSEAVLFKLANALDVSLKDIKGEGNQW